MNRWRTLSRDFRSDSTKIENPQDAIPRAASLDPHAVAKAETSLVNWAILQGIARTQIEP